MSISRKFLRYGLAAVLVCAAMCAGGLALPVFGPADASAAGSAPGGADPSGTNGTTTGNTDGAADASGNGNPPPPRPCGTFKTAPRLQLHTSDLSPGDGPMTRSFAALDAVADVVGAFNDVDATSAFISGTELSSAPFTYDQPYHDATPTIHVGFLKQRAWDKLIDAGTLPENARGATKPVTWVKDGTKDCWLNEVDILFPDTSMRFGDGTPEPWSFAVPPMEASAYATHPFYDAGNVDTSGVIAAGASKSELDAHPELKAFTDEDPVPRLWFRPPFMHELLHAFGHYEGSAAKNTPTAHIENAYSLLNDSIGEGYPWANRESSAMVRPLPAEVGWLRLNYPASAPTSHYDVSVLDTWYAYQKNPDGTSNHDKTQAIKLCAPSLGSKFSSNVGGATNLLGDGYCGVDDAGGTGSLEVCPGDTLRTRFAVTNASNVAVDVHLRLAMSADETWGGTGDAVSHTAHNVTNLDRETSKLTELTWEVPPYDTSKRGALWHTLVEASGDHFSTDWIPLRGLVVTPASGC
jgi:hypothetical protein